MNGHNFISNNNKKLLKFYRNLLSRFKELENSLSIVIQGPLNRRSIDTIPYYLNYGKVIVSCWDTDDLSMLDEYKNKIKIIVNQYSDILPLAEKTHLQNPIILQYYNSYNAIKECDNYFCIKLRSDESYPKLDNLIKKLKENRDSKDTWHKIITSNIYFRYDKQKKFHPSDHIVAGCTIRMKSIYERCLLKCRLGNLGKLGPEELLGVSAIETFFDKKNKRYDRAIPADSISLMCKHFDIIKISDLPGRTWTSSYRKYAKLTQEEDWCHHVKDLDRYG